MEYKMLSKEDYQAKLFAEYNNQNKEDLISLCKESAMIAKETNDEFMNSVLEIVLSTRNITFQQWKAMKVFVKNYNTKKFIKSF